MKALLFGSIGTICDTSELQLDAYNRAFAEHGMDWQWDEVSYRAMLTMAGGKNRIRHYAGKTAGQIPADETIDSVHARKTAIFNQLLDNGAVQPRPGVVRLIRAALDAGVAVGFVTSTETANVDRTIATLGEDISRDTFAVITDRQSVGATKPDPAPFREALESLGIDAEEAVAIEDTEICVTSARSAGLITLATPNRFSTEQDFSAAQACVNDLGDADAPAKQLAGVDVLDEGLVTLESLVRLLRGQRQSN